MRIDGPCGALEARHDLAPQPSGAQAVLSHPHPLYGGSMHDTVLDCLAGVLLAAGVGVLRFNFRGVGGSAGRYDGGDGETDDLLAAARWLRARCPDDALWAGGYSFGAWVTWQALDRGLGADRILLLAPPAGPMAFTSREAEMPADAVIGDLDEFADREALARWSGIKLHHLAGADHFFTGRREALAEALRRLVT